MKIERVKDLIFDRLSNEEFLKRIKEDTMPMETLMCYYRCAIMEVETKFRVLNEEFSLQYDRNPIETIKSRLKSQDSILRKIKTKKIDHSLKAIEDNIYDIAGIRVICSFEEDIYLLADCLLQQDDVKLIERKDYIKNPKDNGYRSLHLIIEIPIFLQNEKRYMKVEVQLRTLAMDLWASLEHKLRYKKDLDNNINNKISNELYECAKLSASIDKKMENIKHMINESKGE